MFTFHHKLSLIFGTVAGVTLAAAMVVSLMSVYVSQTSLACFRSLEILLALDDTRSALESAEAGYRTYLVTGKQHHFDDFNAALSRIPGKLGELGLAAQRGDAPVDQVDRLGSLMDAKLAELSRTIAVRNAQGPDTALALVGSAEDEGTMDELRDQFVALRRVMEAQYNRRARARENATNLRTTAAIGGGVVSFAFVLWAYRLIRRTLVTLEEQRRRAQTGEDRLRFALEAVHAGAWELDVATHVVERTAQYDRLMGYEAFLPRWTVEDFFGHVTPEDRDRVIRKFDEAMRTGQGCELECRIRRHHDQALRWLWAAGQCHRDAAGQTVSAVGILVDITERKQMEQELRQTAEELRRSNEDLEQFSYVASHDLQEPLRMVTSFLKLLSERHGDRLDPDARDYIRFAVDGAQRMSGLITDLLQFARVGTQGKEPQPVALGEIVEHAKENLHAAIAETSAEVAAGPLPTVLGDATQLEQLFQNLIGNALKFRAPERPAGVCIGAERVNGQWRIAVADQGIGIAPEHSEGIFQPFKRLHTRKEYPGTGIGLAVCKKIIERHGGRIWVESQPGKGSTFYVTLKPA